MHKLINSKLCQGAKNREIFRTYTSGMARTLDLRLELRDITPPVWRGLRVPADLTLDDLHQAIQVLMGWKDYHLHVFEVGGREYGPRPEGEVDLEDLGAWAAEASALTVAEAFSLSADPIDYVYDFGDDWRLQVTVTTDTITAGSTAVECVAGEMAGPPEDCGGPHAYQEILDTWTTQGKRGLPVELRAWLPKGFDPMRFNIEDANFRLREAFREKASPEFPAGPHAPAKDQLLANLSLAVLFLGSRASRQGAREAWKTVRFEILDTLQEAGLIYTDPRRKSVVITEAGVAHATAVLQRLAPLIEPRGS